MSAEDLERYEADMELQLYQEYRDVLNMFQYVIETERRFYLANKFDLQVRNEDGETYFDITLHDAWVWDMYRPARFVTRSGSSPSRTSTSRSSSARTSCRGPIVGFNATRRYRNKKTVDIALLVAAIAIVIGLVAWVFAAGGS